MPLLQAQNISFKYNDRLVLDNISFELRTGDMVGIIGPNGSGKSTLLKILDGIMSPESGMVILDGTNISAMKRHILAKTIAVVPQEVPSIFPFSVEQIVLMGRSPHLGKLQFESKTDYKIAHHAMALTNTLHFAHRKINELSGGERQRVWIARALAQEPQIILLDEFTAFLDMRHQIILFDLIKSLNQSKNLTAVIATHDLNLISQYAGKLIMLREGKIHSMGDPDVVVTCDNILTVYETDVLIDKHPETGSPRVTMTSSLSK